jgi:DNA-binding transcriptional LysR family regulator
MKITLKQLAVFDAVARLSSVSGAAREVNLSQSSVSLALQDLERNLDVVLFHRHNRKLSLNENGRRLQPRARSMLQLGREIEVDELSATYPGVLRLAASPTIGNYLMPAICARFVEVHPNVQLKLTVADEPEIIDRVDEIALDIGFIEGTSMRHMLRIEPWISDELVLITRPSHWAAGKLVSMSRLKAENWFLQPIGSSTRHHFTEHLSRQLGSALVGFESNSVEAIKQAVAASGGIACLSRYAVADELATGKLAEIRVRGLRISRTFKIISRKDVYHGLLHAEFREFARNWLPPGVPD